MGFYNGIYTVPIDTSISLPDFNKKFINDFINILHNKSNGKINLISVGTGRDQSNTYDTICYELNIWDILKIKFNGVYNINGRNLSSYVYYKFNDDEEYKLATYNNTRIEYTPTYGGNYDTTYTSTYLIIDNPTSLLLILPDNSSSPYNGKERTKFVIQIIKQDDFIAALIDQVYNISDIGYHSSFHVNDNNFVNFYNLFDYSHNNNDITISEKILSYKTDSNITYCYNKTNTNILDCSEITPYSLVIVNNKKYFSMNSHTLIACE